MKSIYRSFEAEYYTLLPIRRAVESLQRAMAEHLCQGIVTERYVLIRPPGSESSMLPSFWGHFEIDEGTVLTGHFRPARRTQMLFSFWAGAFLGAAALSGTLMQLPVSAGFLAMGALGTYSLERAAARAMQRGMDLTSDLIRTAFYPQVWPSLVPFTQHRPRRPAA